MAFPTEGNEFLAHDLSTMRACRGCGRPWARHLLQPRAGGPAGSGRRCPLCRHAKDVIPAIVAGHCPNCAGPLESVVAGPSAGVPEGVVAALQDRFAQFAAIVVRVPRASPGDLWQRAARGAGQVAVCDPCRLVYALSPEASWPVER